MLTVLLLQLAPALGQTVLTMQPQPRQLLRRLLQHPSQLQWQLSLQACWRHLHQPPSPVMLLALQEWLELLMALRLHLRHHGTVLTAYRPQHLMIGTKATSRCCFHTLIEAHPYLCCSHAAFSVAGKQAPPAPPDSSAVLFQVWTEYCLFMASRPSLHNLPLQAQGPVPG